MLRRTRFAAAVAAATMPLITACGGDSPGPSVLPTLTPTATPTVTAAPTARPTEAPPVRPANADDYSAEGMEAFARYAIDVTNYAYRTGDTTFLSEIQVPSCTYCAGVVKTLKARWANGGRTTGAQLNVIRMFTAGPASGVVPSVGAEVSQSRYQALDARGDVVSESPAVASSQIVLDLTRKGEVWLLAEVRQPGS